MNEIEINGVIGEDTTLVSVMSAVKSLGDITDLTVKINSQGGSVDEGFNIYNYLRGLGVPVTTVAEGMCMSIATVIFLVGNKRVAKCELMVHAPWVGVEGNAEELKSYSEELSKVQKKLEVFYAERTTLTPEEAKTLISTDRYLTPEEAVSLGFATEVIGGIKPLAMLNINKNQNKMSEKKNENGKLMSMMTKAMKKLGFAVTEDALAMVLVDKDGIEITVEREEGDVAIGDVASPDGVFEFEDGSVITIAEGVVTDIKKGVEEEEQQPNEEMEALRAENEALKAENETLQASAVSEQDKKVLNAVKELGGVDGLRATMSKALNFERLQKSEKTSFVKDEINALKTKQREIINNKFKR